MEIHIEAPEEEEISKVEHNEIPVVGSTADKSEKTALNTKNSFRLQKNSKI
jgi:hypothetical protein